MTGSWTHFSRENKPSLARRALSLCALSLACHRLGCVRARARATVIIILTDSIDRWIDPFACLLACLCAPLPPPCVHLYLWLAAPLLPLRRVVAARNNHATRQQLGAKLFFRRQPTTLHPTTPFVVRKRPEISSTQSAAAAVARPRNSTQRRALPINGSGSGSSV